MIEWVLVLAVGALAGGLVVAFWDEIKTWATRMLGYIIDGINRVVEVFSDALVYLEKRGYDIYKSVKVYVMDRSGQTRVITKEQEIAPMSVPAHIRENLERQREILVYQTA